jgi:hypothetical protein
MTLFYQSNCEHTIVYRTSKFLFHIDFTDRDNLDEYLADGENNEWFNTFVLTED